MSLASTTSKFLHLIVMSLFCLFIQQWTYLISHNCLNRQHHDYIPHHQDMPCGVRILTLFIYLNDVEEGGGTHFPLLDITVMPKKGAALLWPSVLDDAPEKKEGRTDHEALPVLKGIKYGANAWIHSRDFKTAFKKNCH